MGGGSQPLDSYTSGSGHADSTTFPNGKASASPALRQTGPMIVITRHRVDPAAQPEFLDSARVALALLAARDGCRGVLIGRAVDEPDLLVLTSEWDSVGAYRKALGSFDVKVGAVPLLSSTIDEATAFEVLHRNGPSGAADSESAVSNDDAVSLGRPAGA